ncbi:hypothetical protein MUO65_03200, partial [bacterium]|nr:hypothetical protein [bacterium]
ADFFRDFESIKTVFGFKEHKDEGSRPANDKKFKECGFSYSELSGNSSFEFSVLMQQLFKDINAASCNLIIDISSMTRAWYGSLINTLWSETRYEKVNASFIYVPAVFPKTHPEYPPNEIVAPVKGFAGLSLSDKPTALVVGLGQDEGRAIGLKESIDPHLTIAFYTSPSTDRRYYNSMMRANKDFLESIPNEGKFAYPILDTISTYNILESVCTGLVKNFRVVLASLGPKIFGLYCFLIASRYPEISVWRISAGQRGNVEDHKASKHQIILDTTWSLIV